VSVEVEVDRAAAVRSALRTLVAQNGFHGASMSAVARSAGVATGTAYTYYSSKDDLVLATYVETKSMLAAAATRSIDAAAPPAERFRSIWLATYRHFAAHPDHARFLVQFDYSPYRATGHDSLPADDPLMAQAAAPDLVAALVPLPIDVLYELGIAPAVRLAAGGVELTKQELTTTADACWRAISRAS